jgi:CRP/FNR family transcriptional regulator, cyclic AMP receptor protein
VFEKPPARPLGHTSEPSRIYQDGELICREGESTAEMYVIRKGSVRIFKASPMGEVHLAVLAKGDFFGEMSVLENLPRDASAQALGETEVLVMTPGALLVRLRRDPTLAFELLRRLSGRVRTLNARLMTALHSSAPPSAGDNMDTLLYRPEEKDDARTILRAPPASAPVASALPVLPSPPPPSPPVQSAPRPPSVPPTSPSLQSSTDIEIRPARRPES